MLPRRNTWRAHNPFHALLAAGVVWFSGVGARAQVITSTSPDAPKSQTVIAPGQVPPAEAIEMFQTIESWVRAGKAPEAGPTSKGFARPTCGASVVIRLDGRIVGRGVRVSPEAKTGFVYEAAEEAIRVAKGELESAGERAPITLSLELAEQMIPMTLGDGEELAMRMSPGLDGLAMRRGSQTAAWFPSQMLERNALPSTVLGPLVSLLGGPVADVLQPPDVLQERGYTIYRFRATQLVTPLPGLSPVFLHRGGRLVNMNMVDHEGMLEFAQGLIAHLGGLQWPGEEPFGLSGSLDPFTGSRDSTAADPIVQATAAMALLRAAHVTGLDPASAERSRALGERLLRELAEVVEGELEPWATVGRASACVIALAEIDPDRLESDESLAGLRDKVLPVVRASFDAKTGYRGVGGTETGLVALALVRDAATFGGSTETATAAVNVVYRDTMPGLLVAQMPWLGWASVGLADLNGGEVAAATRLRAMRNLVWEHRLRNDDLSYDDRDLAGGIVFTKGTTPLPTWQAARPIAFMATMLSRSDLTTGGQGADGSLSGEWPVELVRTLESIRFLMQLAAGTEEGYMYRRPGLARWGVRSSLWDHSMPTEASVLTLLAVCETLDALEQGGGN